MKIAALALSIAVAAAAAHTASAAEGPIPKGIPHLQHVFVIMMENQAYAQIIGNPNAHFINDLANKANLATYYFGVGHPSLTNYLEVVGGSNFGVRSDHSPAWGNNCAPFTPNFESASTGVCPIYGSGTDAETPAVDTTNETSGPPGLNDIDGIKSVPAAANTAGMTIADQLAQHNKSWKSYQEDMSPNALYNVNYSDGVFDNNTDFTAINNTINPPYNLSSSDIVQLYAVKHNPFVYFKNVQDSIQHPENGFPNFAGFAGANGLFADLASGDVPNYSFIAPNQCNDQHGRGNAGPYCAYDPDPGDTGGTQDGTNPALIQRGDVAVKKVVTAIEASPAWLQGYNAIVIVWDENDYSVAPITNQVPLIVVTNYGPGGVQSSTYYNHFSLLKTIEAGFGLPCLNHACDNNVSVMTDLFAR